MGRRRNWNPAILVDLALPRKGELKAGFAGASDVFLFLENSINLS